MNRTTPRPIVLGSNSSYTYFTRISLSTIEPLSESDDFNLPSIISSFVTNFNLYDFPSSVENRFNFLSDTL